MFIIDFRITNNTQYRFSVIGNSNVDKVNLYSRFVQYATDCSIYLKVRSNDDRYVDKIAIANENISVDDGALLCKWTMGMVSTQCKELYLQLQFEKDGDIIDQTQIVKLTLADTINVDELIPVIYPQVLKELKEDIDDLKLKDVKSISQSWNDKTLNISLLNVNNEALASVQVDFSDYAKIEEVKTIVSKYQTNVAIIVSPLTNINGKVMSAYEATFYSFSNAYRITKGGNILDETQARDFIEYMSGTRYLPRYDYNKPNNSYWLMADGTFLKPQFDTQLGLMLYVMTNPFALKSYVDQRIDEIEQRSDVVDVVGTYADLQAYDTSSLAPNSLIKVINDETHNNEITYYRWVVLEGSGTWVYVASEGAYYTTSQIDTMLQSYARFDMPQTFSQKQTFNAGIDLGNSTGIYSNEYNGLQISINGAFVFTIYSGYSLVNSLRPNVDNNYDLGGLANRWKDVHFAGSLKDGTRYASLLELYAQFNPNEASANDEIKWSKMLTFSKSADTTFTFETAKTNCLNEYKAIITNSGASAIVLTFTGITNILCNDDNCVVSGNTLSLPSGTTIEINAVGGNLVAINFSVN